MNKLRCNLMKPSGLSASLLPIASWQPMENGVLLVRGCLCLNGLTSHVPLVAMIGGRVTDVNMMSAKEEQRKKTCMVRSTFQMSTIMRENYWYINFSQSLNQCEKLIWKQLIHQAMTATRSISTKVSTTLIMSSSALPSTCQTYNNHNIGAI